MIAFIDIHKGSYGVEPICNVLSSALGDARRRLHCTGVLILPPMVLHGRNRMSGYKLTIVVYFGCLGLGLGYITVEVGLVSWLTRALTSPTSAASIVLSGMLAISGLRSWEEQRLKGRITCRQS